jgi:hypothetical protein
VVLNGVVSVAVETVAAESVAVRSIAVVWTTALPGMDRGSVSNDPAAGGAAVEEVSTTAVTAGAGSRAAIFGTAAGSGERGGALVLLAAGFLDAVLAFLDAALVEGFRGAEVEDAGVDRDVVADALRVVVVTRRLDGARIPTCVATNARDSAAG